MKSLISILCLVLPLICSSQTKADLIGTWQVEKVINKAESNVADCLKNVKKYTLTFNSDNTYSFNAGSGYITTGNWMLKGDKINYYNSKTSDSQNVTISDHSDPFLINNNGLLVIDGFMCSEIGGKTYYKKK